MVQAIDLWQAHEPGGVIDEQGTINLLDMQSVDKNGLLGEPMPFDQEKLTKMLMDPEIDHVDVFPGTPENMENRKKLVGKKYSPSKGFKKVPSIKSNKK